MQSIYFHFWGMAIRVLCLGKTERGVYQDLLDTFLPRIKKFSVIKWEELPGAKLSLDITLGQEKESESILKLVRSNDFLVLLDEKGKQYTTKKWATWMEQQLRSHSGDMVFVIGSAFGFSPQLYAKANAMVSLSSFTFNHQLVRGIFAEQLYRVLNYNAGGNYHHE